MSSMGVSLRGPLTVQQSELLSDESLSFLASLHRLFDSRRRELLQSRLRQGTPQFRPETAHVRSGHWKIDPVQKDLQRRVVEMTGPANAKILSKALSSSADCFMADLEDATSPTWTNVIEAQVQLRKAALGEFPQQRATLFVRPRGLHLVESHVLVDSEPISGSLFDFGMAAFHGAKALLKRGKTPAYYLPKMESHLEARWWNDVFVFVQRFLNIEEGTFKATCLIETIHAAFEMDEILYELRRHSAGLNCGRWDYIFSFIRAFMDDAAFVTPDRSELTMQVPFMQAYVRSLIAVCHRRGAHAMGGMAAQIPSKDASQNAAALEKVRLDKVYEAEAGHDGTWVAHPGLIETAQKAFESVLKGHPNQLDRPISVGDLNPSSRDLLSCPAGPVTEHGVDENVEVCLEYMVNWLSGTGAVAIRGKMEDLATAEIARAQLCQWVKHGVRKMDSIVSKIEHAGKVLRGRSDLSSKAIDLAVTLLRDAVMKSPVKFDRFIPDSAYPFLISIKSAL